MTQNYYAVNGEVIDINVTGNHFLDKVTFPLWDKVGIPRPLSEADAKLVARMLRNYANLQRLTLGEVSDELRQFHDYFWRTMGYEQDDIVEIELVEKVAEFFDNSGGLVDEDAGIFKSYTKWFIELIEKHDLSLMDKSVVLDILTGKRNLGTYEDFKKNLPIANKRIALYDEIEEYMTSFSIMSAKDREDITNAVNKWRRK